MTTEINIKQKQLELASSIGKLLRDHFGKGPESIYVTISDPYVTVYLRNFLTPMEQALLKEHHSITVEETRDKLMHGLAPEMKELIKSVSGIEIEEFYYDWTLQSASGLFMGIGIEKEPLPDFSYPNSDKVESLVSIVSKEAEKVPEKIYSHLFNSRTLVIIRKGILVEIEKMLIELGFEEELTIAKRKLEKGLLYKRQDHFEKYLNAQLQDVFVNWDFKLDKSTIVFILNPNKIE
ncbi:Na-translocating system protein MpsC family protein [Sutcliffiella deserti]|uniref:Na-translocating system protein MpsC family protein n=1 Tax=Sutcliffiella deserti TaxID=2875501 RepID=UPI001CBBA8E2|nr:Na-translocating system protein MpsC family protein [Sutcliffiella deserti]